MPGLIDKKLDSVVVSSRDKLANAIMIAAIVVGLPTLLASLYRSIDTGWQPVFYFQVCSYFMTVLMVLLRHRVKPFYKHVFISSVFLILGISGLTSWGLVGMGETLLIVFVVVTTAFFGIRAGVIATASILLIFAAVGAGFISEILKLKFDIALYHHAASSWFANAIVITFFTGVAITALGSIDSALKETLTSEIKTENRLQSVMLTMDEGMLIYNEKGKIIFSNNAAQILFAMKENELLGSNIAAINRRIVSEHDGRPVLNVNNTGNVIHEAEVAIKQGDKLRWCQLKIKKMIDPVDPALNVNVVTLYDITEKVETGSKLNKTEKLFSLVTTNANDMVSIHDESGNYTYVSPSCEHLLGYKEKDLLGRNAYELICEEDTFDVGEEHKKLLGDKREIRTTYRIKRRDGSYIWFESIARLVDESQGMGKAIFVVSRDVTENIRTKNALEDKEQQLRAITDALPNYVAELVAGSRFSYVNEAYRQLTGVENSEILGKKISEVFATDAAEEIAAYIERANNGEEISLEREMNITGKKSCWLWLRLIPVTGLNNNVQSIVMLLVDLTQQKRDEQDKEELRLQLAQSQKMEAIGQLTGGIAHDFNNMLASIQGYAELLGRKEWPDEKDRRYLNNILVSAKKGAELVEKLLAFSRGRKKELHHQSLKKIISESVDMARSIMPSSIKIKNKINLSDECIYGDATGINQVIVNLCINARDAMQGKGTLKINVDVNEVEKLDCHSCHTMYAGNYFEVSVSDTGGGISEQYITHIFEPFFSTKEIGKGSGMGLAMVHGIVHEHNGHIHVESIENQGSTFRIYLPVAEPASTGSEIAETRLSYDTDTETEVDVSNIRILLVDDDESVAGFIQEILELSGYRVVYYKESPRALEDFSSGKIRVDIVLTDQTMPGMTGTDMAKAIWALQPEQLIILMSGFNQYIDEEKALDMGFHAYMNKPSTTDEIKVLLDGAVKAYKSVS